MTMPPAWTTNGVHRLLQLYHLAGHVIIIDEPSRPRVSPISHLVSRLAACATLSDAAPERFVGLRMEDARFSAFGGSMWSFMAATGSLLRCGWAGCRLVLLEEEI